MRVRSYLVLVRVSFRLVNHFVNGRRWRVLTRSRVKRLLRQNLIGFVRGEGRNSGQLLLGKLIRRRVMMVPFLTLPGQITFSGWRKWWRRVTVMITRRRPRRARAFLRTWLVLLFRCRRGVVSLFILPLATELAKFILIIVFRR